MTHDLESQINLIASSVGSPGLYGFAAGELSEDIWYVNKAIKSSDAFEVLHGLGHYQSLKDFLKNHKNSLKLFPIIYAASCVLQEKVKNNLRELAEKEYDAVIVTGFSTELYKVKEEYRWEGIKFVEALPVNSFALLDEFWAIYLAMFRKISQEPRTFH